ncbi:MAG: hypothetical protein SFV19_06695 [Rhodospirillaceae bacterium]|nr:hypothetical protein [Rhodospirillaceae bacterium]
MTTIVKQFLSGSSNGKGIKIAATAIASGDTVHTPDGAAKDEVWLHAQNTSAADVKLTVGWGGTTDPDNLIEHTIKAEDGLYLVVPGLPITGASNVIKASASAANMLVIYGYVNRIS